MANMQRSKTRASRPAESRAKELTSRVSDRVSEGYEQVRGTIGEHPATSVFTVFALGFGVGLALGCALSSSSHPSSSWYDRAHAEKFGRRILDSIAGMVPETVAGRFHT
jgi:hypothetical protein